MPTTSLHAPETDAREAARCSDWEQRLLAHAVAPRLCPSARVVEIGSGDGRWTLRIAPLVREVFAVDIDPAMIDRAQTRVEAAGMRNVSFLLGSGRDLAPIASGEVDVVFSYDTFAHLAIEETVAYAGEIARVLCDGGLALVHHAIAACQSRDAIEQMYGRVGLRVEAAWADEGSTVIAARKPADSIVPRLEQALRHAGTADDEAEVAEATRALATLGDELRSRYDRLTAALAAAPSGPARADVIVQIRRLLRG